MVKHLNWDASSPNQTLKWLNTDNLEARALIQTQMAKHFNWLLRCQ